MGHSKTVTETYVASYSYPLFNADDRLDSYLSAELDYTSNSEIEHSEYMKRYYSPQRFRNYRSFLRWWENHGNANVFGRIQATFYGDPTVDNLVVTNAIKPYAYMKEGAKDFLVYSTALNYFSEDAWIKHLATKQGKATWVYQELAYAYTISFPTDTSIKATFTKIPDADKTTYPDPKDWVVEGSLPTYTPNSRFLECAYSYAITKTRQETVIDKDGKEVVVTVPYDERHYGYYTYQEGSGIPRLDSIIANSGTHPRGTFFPVIPIRTNTAWYTEDAAERISDSLRFLEIYSRYKDKPDPYPALINNLVSGINEGSISDIDYMTLVHGVTLNSRNQADLKYMYNFFLNLHVNEALSRGEDPLEVWTPRPTYVGSNYFGAFIEKCVHKWNTHDGGKKIWKSIRNIDNSFHHHLNITCASTNLNYDYSWAQSQYFEANGKFRPDAKVGQYGVLTGTYKYTWTEMVQAYDSEGNPEYHWSGDDESGEWVPTLEPQEFNIPFTFTLFCYQISADRWHFIDFVCLELINHIYAGKTIITTAYEAVTDNSQTTPVTHDFTNDFAYDQLYYDEIEKRKKYREGWNWRRIFRFLVGYDVSPEKEVAEDFRKNNPTKWLNLTFHYGTGLPDSTSPFIVPFELNTFNEVGARTQMDIVNGGLFLVCNCWVQVTYKKKWYQRGIFSSFGGLFGIALGIAISPIMPIVGTALITVSTIVGSIALGAKLLTAARKLLTTIFGERIGSWIYSIIKIVVMVLVAWFAPYALPFVAAGISACETYAQTGSLSKALGAGIVSGVAAYVGQEAFKYAGELANSSYIPTGIASETGEITLESISASLEVNSLAFSETLTAISNSLPATMVMAGGMALAGLIQGFGGTLVNGGSFKDALKSGLMSGAIAGISTFASLGGMKLVRDSFVGTDDKLLIELSHSYYAEENIVQGEEILGGLANINYGVMQDPTFFDQVGGLISKKLLNMNSVTEFVNQSQEAKYMRKLARLESDFAEFNNTYKSYMDVLNTLKSQLTSTVTAEQVAKMQAYIGRMMTQFPDVLGHLSPDEFLQFALTADTPTACISSVSTFVSDKLTIPGYAPEMCFYDQQFLAWAINGED